MSRSQVPFHIQHLARPAHIERILDFASDNRVLDPESTRRCLIGDGYSITLDTVRRSLDWAAKLGLSIRYNQCPPDPLGADLHLFRERSIARWREELGLEAGIAQGLDADGRGPPVRSGRQVHAVARGR